MPLVALKRNKYEVLSPGYVMVDEIEGLGVPESLNVMASPSFGKKRGRDGMCDEGTPALKSKGDAGTSSVAKENFESVGLFAKAFPISKSYVGVGSSIEVRDK